MRRGALSYDDARRLASCLVDGGVALFPTDTVYGLGCDPDSSVAVERLYALKQRSADRPAALMFFKRAPALRALPALGVAERAALRALLPGPVTLLLPNRERRFPLACGPDPDTIGVRVPRLPERFATLRKLGRPLLQSSANLSGGVEARRLDDVPASIREGVDLVLDGGELPGAASTVIDLRDRERSGEWRIVRPGPLGQEDIERLLA
jgi:L-threonylcarbamoyladenylate synthase